MPTQGNKRISQFDYAESLSPSDVLPIVNESTTKKVELSGLTDFFNNSIAVSNGFFNLANSTLTLLSPLTSTTIDGLPVNTKNWIANQEKTLGDDETVFISGDYVMENSVLYLGTKGIQYTIGNLVFKKQSRLVIDGNMLLVGSHIVNDGIIKITGGIILQGSSTITGNGIII